MVGCNHTDRMTVSPSTNFAWLGAVARRQVRANVRPHRRALPVLAADSDVVLRVAGGIVGIAAGIVRAEVRLSGGIDRLVGVAAGEREREGSGSAFASSSSMETCRRTREPGVLGDQVQECKKRRLPQLGGGWLRRDRPELRRWRLRRLRQAGIRKTCNSLQKSELDASFTSCRRSDWRLGLAKEG